MKKFVALVLFAISSFAQAALVDRGGGFVYDTVLDVTWLQDANYAQTSGYDADGKMTWDAALDWADGLSIYDSLRGITFDDWRLPATPQTDPTCSTQVDPVFGGWSVGYFCTGSEMGHLYWGDGVNYNGQGSPYFTNVTGNAYWSSAPFLNSPFDDDGVFVFNMATGNTNAGRPTSSYLAWAVRDGDVAASVVPIPAAVWLFGSGLGLLGWMRRRRLA